MLYRAFSSAGRAPARQAGGRRFKPYNAHHGGLAQTGERGLCKPQVVGSIPISSTMIQCPSSSAGRVSPWYGEGHRFNSGLGLHIGSQLCVSKSGCNPERRSSILRRASARVSWRDRNNAPELGHLRSCVRQVAVVWLGERLHTLPSSNGRAIGSYPVYAGSSPAGGTMAPWYRGCALGFYPRDAGSNPAGVSTTVTGVA
jgi:hypothetical protein